MDLEHGVVGRHRLKGNVAVPACRCKTTYVGELVGEATAFLLLFAADDGDLVAKFRAFFCEGVDVEAG